MLSTTHITVGVAAALAICRPVDGGGVIGAVIGGAAGGILCDIECHATATQRDSLRGRVLTVGLSAVLLTLDWFLKSGLIAEMMAQSVSSLFLGAAILCVTAIIGHFTEHRTFTHSLVYVSLIALGFCLLTPRLGIPAFFGGISHLALDTLNKKPVPWLYPHFRRGVCLHLCYAGKSANTALLWAGLIGSFVLIAERMTVII